MISPRLAECAAGPGLWWFGGPVGRLVPGTSSKVETGVLMRAGRERVATNAPGRTPPPFSLSG
jgi:hypothetical protein